MRILLIVDPYKIRGHWRTPIWIVQKYVEMVSELEGSLRQSIKIFCSQHIARHLIEQGADAELFTTLSRSQERADFNEARNEWDERDVRRWEDHMRGRARSSDVMLRHIDELRQDFDFEGIVYWGTNLALQHYCLEQGIPVLFSELGPLRPPYGFLGALDSFGVNGHGFPARVTLADIIKQEDHLFEFQDEEIGTQRSKTVLAALQNMDDSNLLIHRGEMSYDDFILSSVSLLANAGHKVLVCPHPGAYRYRYTYVHQCQLLSTLAVIPGVSIQKPFVTAEIMPSVDVVVAYNSSVAFEALCLGKPIVLGGAASFAPKGLSLSVKESIRPVKILRENLAQYLDFMARYYVKFDELFALPRVTSELQFWSSLNGLENAQVIDAIASKEVTKSFEVSV
ncbi:hypothetical protein ACFOEZ_17325 [Tianweitania populi]|uniref:Glycosyltransferase 99 N-terminal domain-containing protein n=1 Tax=Tianweitania populi TaxID=1607949 RepID=A0A8J3GKS4_9HYPH|nr:hypothetical protein [Tianweitania populi]GHD14544.1 hypothetical protein GCM10016234_20230 [Tianweitania populi]